MSYEPLEPARIRFDAGAAPYAEDFDDVYHSADGGPGQARAVFLAGNALPQRWRGRDSFTIVETGFGIGLNFLVCAAELASDSAGPRRLHYVAVEKHPPSCADLASAHARWPQLAALAAELRRKWPPPLRGFHRLDLAGGRIVLTLLFGEAAPMLAELDARADALFLDGFAPAKNPAMWSEALFAQLARLSGAGTTAATWSVAAAVRVRLQQAGFRVEKRAGFGHKREMLCAVRADDGPSLCAAPRRGRNAVVIGAGIAGCWMAYALAQRGWNVTLLERHPAPAQESSGNAVGVVRPAFNLADNVNARLSRAAFLRCVGVLAADTEWQGGFGRSGVLHVATGIEQAQRMAAITAAHSFPESYVRWVDAQEATRIAGSRVAGPAWWIPDGGWAGPRQLCDRLLAHASPRVVLRYGAEVYALEPGAGEWSARDHAGDVLAQAPVLILAGGYGARRLCCRGMPELIGVRGQVTFLPPSSQRSLDVVVGGDGYVAPLRDGGYAVGATFEPGVYANELRAEDHVRNLERAERMLPGFARGLNASGLQGWSAVRAATADRLPACGALEDAAPEHDISCHVVAGLGARGLIWAPLCAEVLASRLEGEPNPIERSLIAAMDPRRKALRSAER